LIPIQVFACMSCGSVNEEFLPIQMRQQPQSQPTEPEEEGGRIIKF